MDDQWATKNDLELTPNTIYTVKHSIDGKRCYFCDADATHREQEEAAGELLRMETGPLIFTDSSANIMGKINKP